jgi:hypothetical protein
MLESAAQTGCRKKRSYLLGMARQLRLARTCVALLRLPLSVPEPRGSRIKGTEHCEPDEWAASAIGTYNRLRAWRRAFR